MSPASYNTRNARICEKYQYKFVLVDCATNPGDDACDMSADVDFCTEHPYLNSCSSFDLDDCHLMDLDCFAMPLHKCCCCDEYTDYYDKSACVDVSPSLACC